MKKSLAFSIVVCVLWLYGIVDANGLKTTELNRKMSEISSLQQSLTAKIAQADQKRDQLEQKALELRNEIKSEMEQFRLESYQVAIQNPRIDYNLKLIQLMLGYIDRLNEKIEYFKNGNATLTFFFQQAEDDLLMIKALSNLETDKHIGQINEVLDEYIPETSKPMFDVNDVPLKDTEKIWHEIIRLGNPTNY